MHKYFKWTDGIRWLTTIILFYFISKETSPIIVLTFALIFIYIELDIIVGRMRAELFKNIIERIKK